MTDHLTNPTQESSDDFLDKDGPGSDPGEAYDRAVEDDGVRSADDDPGPDVGDVYRSGS